MIPQVFRWNGRVLEPLRLALAERAFKPGEVYRLAIEEERSIASHNHFFAAVTEAWRNMPLELAEYFPSPEALRKRALIEAGFYDQQTIACGSPEVALRVAAFAGRNIPHCLVSITDQFVFVRTARSQSRAHMNAAEFQESKQRVLETLAALIKTKPAELLEHAERE